VTESPPGLQPKSAVTGYFGRSVGPNANPFTAPINPRMRVAKRMRTLDMTGSLLFPLQMKIFDLVAHTLQILSHPFSFSLSLKLRHFHLHSLEAHVSDRRHNLPVTPSRGCSQQADEARCNKALPRISRCRQQQAAHQIEERDDDRSDESRGSGEIIVAFTAVLKMLSPEREGCKLKAISASWIS